MPLRAQYLSDVELPSNPYPVDPAPRIVAIYCTARRGSIREALALDIWTKHLCSLHASAVTGTLPAIQGDFDDLIVNTALKIESTLKAIGKGGFGVAQKIVNLFLKDLWAFGIIRTPFETLLHAPIDRGLLGRFKTVPPMWVAWTKAVAGKPRSKTVKHYRSLQDQLRVLWSTSPIKFPSVIQMDQFLWHQIP